MSDHALLAPSSSHRWLHCTPSARLEAQEPDTAGESAQEGSLAHEIAELKLRKYFLEPMGTRTYNARMKKFKAHPLYREEMQPHTDTYLEYIKQIAMQYPQKPYVAVETRLEDRLFVPDSFGRVDCTAIYGGNLHIVDFKYGKNVDVSAENNPQLMLYALYAIQHYRMFYDIQQVHLAIVQPRCGGVKEWSTTRDAVLDWGQFTVKPRAKAASSGEGELCKGDWCTFCRVKAKCPEWAKSVEAVKTYDGKLPPLLTNEEVGRALRDGKAFVEWYRALDKYALSAVLRGESIPGWKAVAGRGNRTFRDVDKAFDFLTELGFDRDLFYERSPLTPAKVEKVVGKAEFAKLVPDHLYRPDTKPALAPEEDPRPAYQGVDATQYFQPQGGTPS